MIKTALTLAGLPALLLAAMPAEAAIDLTTAGLTVFAPDNPFGLQDVEQYKRVSGAEPKLLGFGPDNPGLLPTAVALPEPASWAMMIGGLAFAGWSLRAVRRRPASA